MSAWGSLGDHTFGLRAGPSAETLKIGADVATHSRIGRKPTQQHTAPKLQEYELSITLHNSDYDVANVIDALRESCETSEILDLVIGDQPNTGAWAGQWVILDLDVETIKRAPGGGLYSADVKIKLREWVQREGLETSQRKPPPAVRPKKPAAPAGSGYARNEAEANK